jgi:hypothetical protein
MVFLLVARLEYLWEEEPIQPLLIRLHPKNYFFYDLGNTVMFL